MAQSRAYDLLKKISFERRGGTTEELDCIAILQSEIEALGVKSYTEEFDIDSSEIKDCRLEVLEPYYRNYNVTGYKMSGSTDPRGIEGHFQYVEDGLPVNLYQAKGKIVLINNRFDVPTYKRLVDSKVAGFISTSGSLYDDFDKTDLETRSLRERQYRYGKIPGVTMRIKDAEEFVLSNPKKVRLTLVQNEGKTKSRNLICEIKGSTILDEVVCFTAHYDSVEFSSGAYDNGTGSVTIMELLRYFVMNKPKRTVRFIWCGSEEMGLLGSKAYVKDHKDILDKIVLNINLDMTGVVLGKDIAVCTAENSLVNYIDYMGKEIGFPIRVRQGVYSSDSTPFADNGIPAVSFARISANGGAEIHTRKDVIDFITPEYLDNTISFLKEFSNRVVNSHTFPVERSIPKNMKEELDKYLGRNDPKLDDEKTIEEEKKVEEKPQVKETPKTFEKKDELLLEVVIFLMNNKVISSNKLQSEFYLGQSRANAILNKLVDLKIIGNSDQGPVFLTDLDTAVRIVSKYLED